MTAPRTNTKRWRPRFSIRTMVIVVTLVCCYAACWEPTKRQGVEDVASYVVSRYYGSLQLVGDPRLVKLREYIVANTSPRAPMVISINAKPNDGGSWRRCYYYFWFFGYVAKLPFEREL